MWVDFKIDEVLNACEGRLITGGKETCISRFSIDSREEEKFDCFIALKGRKFDGHHFIPEAIDKGAKVIIFQKGLLKIEPSQYPGIFFIEVNDSYQAVYNLARYKRRKFQFPILGITGSTAKTTVKELCARFLSLRYDCVKNYLNQNNLLGLSLNILNCDRQYEFGIFELGISKPGEMDLLLDILSPHHGLITNIGPSHLEFLYSEEKVFEEKAKLFERLPPENFGFYSRDDRFLVRFDNSSLSLNFITFGFSKSNKYWAQLLKIGIDGSEVMLWNGRKVKIPLLGSHNAFNILAAMAVALEFSVPEESVLETISHLEAQPGRFQHYRLGKIHVLDDSYNSNPLSLRKALEFLSQVEFQGLKIAVLGDMLELGENSAELHFRLGKYARDLNIHKFFCYGEEMKNFVHAVGDRAEFCFRDEIAGKVLQFYNRESIVLFKASRGMQVERIIQEIKEKIAANAV